MTKFDVWCPELGSGLQDARTFVASVMHTGAEHLRQYRGSTSYLIQKTLL